MGVGDNVWSSSENELAIWSAVSYSQIGDLILAHKALIRCLIAFGDHVYSADIRGQINVWNP